MKKKLRQPRDILLLWRVHPYVSTQNRRAIKRNPDKWERNSMKKIRQTECYKINSISNRIVNGRETENKNHTQIKRESKTNGILKLTIYFLSDQMLRNQPIS